MRIGVIIPVHNQGRYFNMCLDTMCETGDADVRLYAIDVASNPGEFDLSLAKHTFRTYRYDENPGVTKPWNQGIRMAMEDESDVVCVANSDILWGPETIERCAAVAAKHYVSFPLSIQAGSPPNKFDQMARMLAYAPAACITPELAEAYLAGSSPRNRQSLMDVLLDPSKRVNAPTGGFAGWCFFLSRACVERFGLFDEQFVLWYQDTDYHWRLSRAGIQPFECRNCIVHHYESRSIIGLKDGFNHQGWRAGDEQRFTAKWAHQK